MRIWFEDACTESILQEARANITIVKHTIAPEKNKGAAEVVMIGIVLEKIDQQYFIVQNIRIFISWSL